MSYRARTNAGSAQQKKVTTEKNQQILRALLKDPSNKFCADCKTSGHPRWTSWSLGIFICIRCSGIHRSMGTHISKVRSIDLDTWSTEQVEPLVKWGNKRANIYWEAKLPPNYVPDDSKIENFIKTKYDMKRWVLSNTIPDPSTLDSEGASNAEDSVPLSEVQKRLAQPRTQRLSVSASSKQTTDLLGNDAPFVSRAAPTTSTQKHTVTSNPAGNVTHTKPAPAPQAKPTPALPPQPSASLIGLDFGSSPALPTPASAPSAATPSNVNTNARPDLKKSILSLYSSAPAPQPSYQQHNSSFGGFQQTQQAQQPQHVKQASFSSNGGFDSLTTLTGGMSLGSGPVSPVVQQSQFVSMSQPAPPSKPQTNAFDDLFSGGAQNWTSKPMQPSQSQNRPSTSINDNFSSFTSPTATNNSSNTFAPTRTTVAAPAAADEWADFTSPSAAKPAKQGGFEDDIFNNVWK